MRSGIAAMAAALGLWVGTGAALADPAPAPAPAGAPWCGVGLTAKAGTLGVGGDLTVGLTRWLGIRVGGNWLSIDPGLKIEEGTFHTDLRWLSYEALLDVHPFGGGFRLTAGAMFDQNEFNLTADLAHPVSINDANYGLSQLGGRVKYPGLAPYVGLGYGNAAAYDARWHFAFDLGVMFQGDPDVTLNAVALQPILQSQLQADLDREAGKIHDTLKKYNYYPVLSIGVSFRF